MRHRRAWLALLLLPWLLAPASPGTVRGAVKVGIEGVDLTSVGPVVVYLDAADGERLDFSLPARRPRILQRDARFAPGFLVVTAGQTVDMPNEDGIFHNVFSYSRPNDFDLGLYPSGESRQVTLRHPGLVRLYCSIHESMNGAIYVVPSPWFALAGAGGRFEIRGVPPGRYRLRTWAEKLPAISRSIALEDGATLDLALDLAGGR
jgi:hypothetical protein